MFLDGRLAKLTKTSCNNSCSSRSITLQCKRRGLLLLVGLSPGHSHSTTIAFLLPRSLCIPFAWLARLYPLDAFALILRLRIVATFLSKAAKNYQVIVRFSLFLVTAVANKSVYDETLSRESIFDRRKSFPPLFSRERIFEINSLIKIATASLESRNDFPRDVNSMTGEEYQTVINMYSGNRLAWYPLLPLLYSSCL